MIRFSLLPLLIVSAVAFPQEPKSPLAPGGAAKPIFDPRDERIQGFVTQLKTSKWKLEPEPSSKTGLWRIVEPKFEGGIVRVGFCSFNESITEDQMREVLKDVKGWRHFNARARLAMTAITTEGFDQGKPDELAELGDTLRYLFFWHQRPMAFPIKNQLSNKVVDAGLNPKGERILAYVAYLERNGIKLKYEEEIRDWRIIEPKHDDGWPAVSIRTLPLTATEEQMRFALANINLAYDLNVDAHLAMSGIGTWGSKGSPLPLGLEAKLQRLFHDYILNEAGHGWKKTDDGLLAVHFSVTPTKVKPDEPIELTVKTRNISDKPITIKRPFPWPGYAIVSIRGSGGNLGRHGDPPPRMEEKWWRVGGALATLKPGEEFKDSVKLEWQNYPDLRTPGRYAFTYDFSHKSSFDDLEKRAKVTLWKGQMELLTANVEVVRKDSPKPK